MKTTLPQSHRLEPISPDAALFAGRDWLWHTLEPALSFLPVASVQTGYRGPAIIIAHPLQVNLQTASATTAANVIAFC